MTSPKRIIWFWILTWLVPFLVSMPSYGKGGLPMVDIFLIKTIMIIVWASVGWFLLIKYFSKVEKNFLRESLFLGLIWLGINRGLDFIILIPMSGISIQDYMIQTGLRYFMILIFSLTIGYALEKRN